MIKQFLFLPVFAVAAVAVSCAKPMAEVPAGVTAQTGIVGGAEVAADDAIAKTTALVYLEGRAGVCTASVLNENWVLTAAHCADHMHIEKMEVVFALQPGPSGQTTDAELFRKVSEIRIHPDWSDTQKRLQQIVDAAKARGREATPEEIDVVKDWADVAVLKLDHPIPKVYQPVHLAPAETALTSDETLVLAGYGNLSSVGGHGFGAGVLREVEVKVAQPLWGTKELLVDQQGGQGACHGDSGGPAFVQLNGELYLISLLSRGVQDRFDICRGFSVYTYLAPYLDWIIANAR